MKQSFFVTTLTLISLASTASAEGVYGGFSVGTGVAGIVQDTPGPDDTYHGAFTLSGKLGGRTGNVGGYSRLRSSAWSDSSGYTLVMPQLGGGFEAFFDDERWSSVFVEVGGSWLSLSNTAAGDIDVGAGPYVGVGLNLTVAGPFAFTFGYDHAWMHASPLAASVGLADFSVHHFMLETTFQW